MAIPLQESAVEVGGIARLDVDEDHVLGVHRAPLDDIHSTTERPTGPESKVTVDFNVLTPRLSPRPTVGTGTSVGT